MRIDGRFDPKQWIQPRAKDAEVSTNIEEQLHGLQMSFTVSEQSETDLDFAGEMQTSYAYNRASRTAEAVAEMLEATPDL